MTAALISQGGGIQPVPEHDLESLCPEHGSSKAWQARPRRSSANPMVRTGTESAGADTDHVSGAETPAPEADESSPEAPA